MVERWISFLVSNVFECKRNDHVWPSQHHVVSSDYTLWRKAMEFLFPDNLHLRQPLGNWIIKSDSEWTDKWDWFLSTEREFFYFRLDSRTWHRFFKLPHAHLGYHDDFWRYMSIQLATFAGLQFVLEMGVYTSLVPFTEPPQLTPQQTIFNILWETE